MLASPVEKGIKIYNGRDSLVVTHPATITPHCAMLKTFLPTWELFIGFWLFYTAVMHKLLKDVSKRSLSGTYIKGCIAQWVSQCHIFGRV